MPCVAKHLLRCVLSTTPGNLFAEYTMKLSEKQEARTGATPVLTVVVETFLPDPVPWTPTLTKEKRSLELVRECWGHEDTYIPESAFSSNREILKDKPNSNLVFRIGQSKSAGC